MSPPLPWPIGRSRSSRVGISASTASTSRPPRGTARARGSNRDAGAGRRSAWAGSTSTSAASSRRRARSRAPARPTARARGRRSSPARSSTASIASCGVRRVLDALEPVLLDLARVELVVGLEPVVVAHPVHRERVACPRSRSSSPNGSRPTPERDPVGRVDLEARSRGPRRAPRRCASRTAPPRGRRPRSRSGGARRRSGTARRSRSPRAEAARAGSSRRPPPPRSPGSPPGASTGTSAS